MLTHHPNIDDHLDFLENQEGNLFFLSRAQVGMNNCKPFVKEVIDTIITSDDKHTVIIVEEPPHRWGRHVRKTMQSIGTQVEKHDRYHQIHAFVVPTELYQLLLSVDRSDLN